MPLWTPQTQQARFIAACGLADPFNPAPPLAPLIGYGGAAGGGKTDALLGLAGMLAGAFPKSNVVYFRRTLPELEGPGGAILRSLELFSGYARYNEQKHRWRWPNGSITQFLYCGSEKDVYNYQSQQFDVILIDEATHFTWPMVDYLLTRNRATVNGLIPFAAMTANPGNVGHVWYCALFIDHEPLKVVEVENPSGKIEKTYFIPAKLSDNPILEKRDPGYRAKLEGRDDDTSRALLEADWTVFAGQAFRRWRKHAHVVEPFEIPENWLRWRAVDWGYEKPWCCLWLAKDPDTNRMFVYREAYDTGLDDWQQAQRIVDMTLPNERIGNTFADPSMWGKKTAKNVVTSAADSYKDKGVVLTKADNARINGKHKVDQVLGKAPDGLPGLQVFENCVNLIRTLPLLVRDNTNPEDVDTTQEDHAYDALRYGLTSLRIAGEKRREQNKNPWIGVRSM